ncbi:uncharacterized protein [Coffea arabica]|uniref:Uncharacterized protein isoform X2 n=1 Tax=Coffea arabica TaxID=13443 RepID=A0A6P6V2Q1_COFAR|nr:uncharacterized protein LOC113716755 isoform X3 [Coffea arabica]
MLSWVLVHAREASVPAIFLLLAVTSAILPAATCYCFPLFQRIRMCTILSINDVEVGMEKWTAKVTVQEKQQVTSSISTPTRKQKFIFIDSEGSKVEGIIFNADIAIMSPRIEVYKKYLISNVQVKKIPENFRTTELAIQWIITSRTIIEEIVDDEDVIAAKFTYTNFTDLAQYMDRKDISVDIMGIVIATLDEKTVIVNSKEARVQKLVLVNEELQTLMLSMWNAFIDNEGSKIISEIQNYPVLIGRRLKVQNYNGQVEMPNALQTLLQREHTLDTILISLSKQIKKLLIYQISAQNTRCKFDVDLSDDTGTVTATMFGDLAEKLLTFTTKEAMEHYFQNMVLPLEVLHEDLKSKKFLAYIRPVQVPLANAKQRFTMVYYKEASDEQVSVASSSEQAFTCPSSGGTSSSKAKVCLLQKFDESDEQRQLSSEALQTSPKKKARQA